MPRRYVPESGDGRTILVVAAHADDFALFCGGTIALWADHAWRVVAVRLTDDRWDSIGLDEAATIEANRSELEEAAGILGIAEIVELGYPTDLLGDASLVALRERIIRLIRTHRPYATATFDPYSAPHEDNQDHIRLAQAVDEAFWTSQFDKHHPEHAAEGLEPHGAFERWYFGRRVHQVTDVVDISATLERKIGAATAHATPMRNYAHQLVLQARTGGWRLPGADAALAGGPIGDLLAPLLHASAAATGARHGLEAAEEFRVVRFGGLDALLERDGVRL